MTHESYAVLTKNEKKLLILNEPWDGLSILSGTVGLKIEKCHGFYAPIMCVCTDLK